MARIPTVTSQIAARSGRTSQGVPTPQASPEAFGAGVGRGLQVIGAGLQDLSQGLYVREKQKRKEDAANAVAQADFTRTELELRNDVGPGAAGYQQKTLEAYDAFVDEHADAIEDDETRKAFRETMASQRNAVSARAAQYEFGTAAQHSKNEADASLTAIDNKIRTHADQYATFVQQGEAVIDARPGLTTTAKSAMKRAFREGAALSRFEGMLERTKSPEDVDVLTAEVKKDEWTARLSSPGIERILSLADATKKALVTKADADARSAVEFLEGRASDPAVLIPREELDAAREVVGRSTNPMTTVRFARVLRDQEIVRQTRRMTPAQQRAAIQPGTSLPSRLNAAIHRASTAFGVSPAYLAATVKREYGVFLKGEDTDWTRGNIGDNSTALGPMQFIEDTWLGVVRNPTFQAVAGIDITGKSRDELLAMRGDVDLALLGGAFFTAQNADTAKRALGRDPTDADLYIMHFMGAGGGTRLFRMVATNPNVLAADMFPEQAKANHSVYYRKDGKARTVVEVYEELSRMHGGGTGTVTHVEYEDIQTREKVLKDTEARLADDPMTFAASVGTGTVSDVFTPGGMAQRGIDARQVADYYNIPVSGMKPFTKDELSAVSKRFSEGSADDVLEILTSVQQMGGNVARAAMSQLGKVDDVYAFAGGLALETGQAATAADVVRGQRRVKDNPDIQRQIGATEQDISNAFMDATGGALMDAVPDQRQAVMDAALAHYAETSVARGRAGRFDPDMFAASVQAVLGGRQGAPALDEVNGARTVLPPGVSGAEIETAFNNMTMADWASMSEQGLPPRYVTGALAEPDDIADEATLRAIGGGRYRVALGDGSYLVTGRPGPNGRLEAFVFAPTADRIREVNTVAEERAVQREAAVREQTQMPDVSQQVSDIQAAMEDGTLTLEEQQMLFSRYGAMWAYDDQGNRIAPTQ